MINMFDWMLGEVQDFYQIHYEESLHTFMKNNVHLVSKDLWGNCKAEWHCYILQMTIASSRNNFAFIIGLIFTNL